MMEVPYLFNIFVELPAEREPIVKFISDSFKVSKRLRVVLKSASRDPKISNENLGLGLGRLTVKIRLEIDKVQKSSVQVGTNFLILGTDSPFNNSFPN